MAMKIIQRLKLSIDESHNSQRSDVSPVPVRECLQREILETFDRKKTITNTKTKTKTMTNTCEIEV